MKKFLAIILFVALGVESAFACTNLIVGKKASADGSVMCSYNCDGFGFSGSLSYSPPGRHAADELIAIHGWGPPHEGQYVKQVEYTYNVVGLMNEKQVTIVETTFDGRLILVNNEGLLDYFSLMRLALQRSATAREAIKCMVELVDNDQIIRRTDENGQILRWGYDTPGYDQQFIDAVGKSTGDRYKLKEVINRRER